MIELIIGGVVVGGMMLIAAGKRKARAAFLAERGLTKDQSGKFSGVTLGVPVQLAFRTKHHGKSTSENTELWFKTGPSSLVVKDTPMLDRAGITSSDDFVTGDVPFDSSFLVQGLPTEIAFALGQTQRSYLLSLKSSGKVVLEHGTLFVDVPTHDIAKVGHAFDLGAKVAAHLPSQTTARDVELKKRLTDPHPQMRTVTLLAVAEASRSEADILAVRSAELHPSHAARYWMLARGSHAETARKIFDELIVLPHASLLRALLVDVPSLTPRVDERVLFPLLLHAEDDIRITVATLLGGLGTIAAVPHLRKLEGASVFARKQVNTARQAITAIQSRAGSGELAGALSIGDDARGALSKDK